MELPGIIDADLGAGGQPPTGLPVSGIQCPGVQSSPERVWDGHSTTLTFLADGQECTKISVIPCYRTLRSSTLAATGEGACPVALAGLVRAGRAATVRGGTVRRWPGPGRYVSREL